MASEVFQLAILLSLKDSASGQLDYFAARAHSATTKVEQDLKNLEKAARAETQAIAKDIGKKTSEIDKLGKNLSKVDELKNKGLQNSGKQASSIATQLRNESNLLEDLAKNYQKTGRTDAAKEAETLAKHLRDESRQLDQISNKLKQIQKLRQQGTDESKKQAKVLEDEVKQEVAALDKLSGKLRDVKRLKSDNLEVKIKADSLKNTVNQMRDFEAQYDNLRETIGRHLALAGTGVAGLTLIGKGVKVAGDFQASMTDLRSSFAELRKDGNVNLDALGKDMLKAEAIAIQLDNKLPGTTEDFVQMMQVLKQNGTEVDAIFNGAAEAVGNLAVANNEVPKELAKSYAQFAKLFNLKPDEYIKAADTMSRLYSSSGINSAELIESLKYFQGRSGAALNLTGLEDAEKTLRIMGLLRKQGLEGSLAGTALHNLFAGYMTARSKKENPIQMLKDLEGIDIKLFDDKGKFLGLDNLFKQLEPLKKLSDEKRTSYLKNIFGEEGMSAATAILKTGAEGWKQYNEEQNKTISLQQKVDEKSKDFNNQVEALTGSLKNLVVTGFTPLLPLMTSAANTANSFIGTIQDFAKANPNLTSTIAKLALMSTTAVTLLGTVKALATGWRIFTMMRGNDNMIGFLQGLTNSANQANVSTVQAGTQIANTTGKLAKLKSFASNPIIITLGLIGAEVLISEISKAVEKSRQLAEQSKLITQNYDRLMGLNLAWNNPGDYAGQKSEFDAHARLLIDKMKRGDELEFTLNSRRYNPFEAIWRNKPYGGPQSDETGKFKNYFDPNVAGKRWSNELGVSIQDPNVLARLLIQLKQDSTFNEGNFKQLVDALTIATSKEKMQIATSIMQKENPNFTSQQNYNRNPLQQLGQNPLTNNRVLFNPFGSSNFQNNQNQLQNPLFQPQNNQFTGVFQNLPQLNQPVRQTVIDFQNLGTPINTTIEGLGKFSEQLTQAQLSELFNGQTKNLTEFGQTLINTQQPITDTQKKISDLGTTAERTKGSLYSIINSGNNVANSLDILSSRISNWQTPSPTVQTYNFGFTQPNSTPNQPGVPSIFAPSKASGGTVLSKGLAYIHANEDIVPAKVTREYRGGILDLLSLVKSRGGYETVNSANVDAKQNVTIHYAPNVTISGNSATELEQQFQAMLNKHAEDIEDMVAYRLQRRLTQS